MIFSEYEGMLHLHSAYADSPSSGKILIALLRKAYDQLAQEPEHFSGFSTTSVNDTSEKLVNTLLTDTEPVKRHIFYTPKPLFRSTPMLPEWGGILARSNALMDILANAGGSVSLVTNPGMLPYFIWQPGNGMSIRLFYSLNDQTYTSFSLSAELSLNASAKKLKPLTQIMEEDPGPAQLVPDTTGKFLALVGVLEEGAVLDPAQTLDSFLMPFIEQAKRLLTMMKENEN